MLWAYTQTKDKFDRRAHIWEEKHLNLQSVKLITFLFFQIL